VIVMDEEIHMKEHIEILSIIKEKLSKIPENEMIEYNALGDSDNAQFVFLQFLKQTIMEESDMWITHYLG